MGDGKCNPRIHSYMYAMSQLCVKVMVDDESLSIAVLVQVRFKSLHVGYK